MPVRLRRGLRRGEKKWYHGHCVRLLLRQKTDAYFFSREKVSKKSFKLGTKPIAGPRFPPGNADAFLILKRVKEIFV